jgi:hypothetical protein
LPDEFEVIHTFEFLEAKPGARVLVADATETPVVIQHPRHDRVLYVNSWNSCTHSCLSKAQVRSPLETSREFGRLIRNAVIWGLQLSEGPLSMS